MKASRSKEQRRIERPSPRWRATAVSPLAVGGALFLALGTAPSARAQAGADVGARPSPALSAYDEEGRVVDPESRQARGESGEAGGESATGEGTEGSRESGEAWTEAREVPGAVRGTRGGTAGQAPAARADGEEDPLGPPPRTTRFVPPLASPHEGDFLLAIPPLLIERRGSIATTAVFPFFHLREEPGHSELVVPPYYHREGRVQGDVLFPLFWWLRGEGWHSWIVPPLWSHADPEGHDVGVFPLLMSGRHRASYYHVLPPLLAVAWGDEDEDYLFAGALFYRLRVREEERWGLFPFLWFSDTPNEQYQFVAPFYFRYRNARSEQTLHFVPPGLFYFSEEPRERFWGVLGLVHHDEGPGFHSTTIPPLLFHWSEEPQTFRLATPLFLYLNERGSETLVTALYQRYRGATEFDGVVPFFFWVRDPREFSETLVILPFFARWTSPASANTIVFPFFADFEEYGRRRTWLTPLVANSRDLERGDETTWILPTLQISRWHDGEAVNFHPIWYYERVPSHRHHVLAPLWFDFEQFERGDRYTVAFPFYWRFREGVTETQLFLTTYFRRREWRNERRWEWEFHFPPLFDFGERSDGEHWWRVLYGLVGWERRRAHDRLWLFYIPIDVGHAPFQPTPSAHPDSRAQSALEVHPLP